MAQYLKDEIQKRIASAALAVFAEHGFNKATMADIGRRAGVSTGNIYRYYENKDVLFYSLITDRFVEELLGLLRRKVNALRGVNDYRMLAADSPYQIFSEELLAFCIQNRQRVIILLGRGEGTRFEGFPNRLVDDLVKLAETHFRGIQPTLQLDRSKRFCLREIYENLIKTTMRILVTFDSEEDIRKAVDFYSEYHLVGLKSAFD